MSVPEEITSRFLRSFRNQFYKGQDKFFFQERNLLIMAITYPATWLDERSLKLPAARYTALLTDIIRTINKEGNLAEIKSPARYLLKCIQTHMEHHGEDYLHQAKAIDQQITGVFQGLIAEHEAVAKARSASIDTTVPTLAATHRVLSAANTRRKREAKTSPKQQSLF